MLCGIWHMTDLWIIQLSPIVVFNIIKYKIQIATGFKKLRILLYKHTILKKNGQRLLRKKEDTEICRANKEIIDS